MRRILVLIVLWMVPQAGGADDVVEIPHAKVFYEGIEARQAEAFAATTAAAREVYAKTFKFDMPETVIGHVKCSPAETTRLYTGGQDSLFLSIPSAEKLARPDRSGVFNVYGICHELGHIAMYRVLIDRDWMSSPAAEGWAGFAGAVVVDEVFAARGEQLWCDPYDYGKDGTARLDQQLASKRPSAVVRAAGAWQKLEAIVGRQGFARLFAAWQSATIDPADPADKLLAVAQELFPKKNEALAAWWKTNHALFVEKRRSSKIKAKRIPSSRLSGDPLVLTLDDDTSEGKKSIAGGGHARKFTAPGNGEWYLRAVWLYGTRYGHPKPPNTTFDVGLCDHEMKTITVSKKPYKTFDRGAMRWVRMEVRPTRVPATFYVCLNFRPARTRGVYVGFDTSTRGNSLVATPGKPGSPFDQGDWMIRVELDQPKTANPLKPE